LDDKNNQIYNLADKFATLADQAQRLNLADKRVLKSNPIVIKKPLKKRLLRLNKKNLRKNHGGSLDKSL